MSGSLGPSGTASWTFSQPAAAVFIGTVSETDATRPISVDIVNNTTGTDTGFSGNPRWFGGGTGATAASYTVILKRSDALAGNASYTITNVVAPASPAPSADEEGGPLQDELPKSGSVNYGDLDVYWFDANASDTGLNVEMDYTAGFEPAISLIGSNGGTPNNGVNTSTSQLNDYYYNNPAGRIYVVVWPPSGQTNFSTAPNESYTLILHGATASPAGQVGKSLGPPMAMKSMTGCGCSTSPQAANNVLTSPGSTGSAAVADPINPANGNVFDAVTDYTTAGQNPLALIRYYNSAANLQTTPFAVSLGANWRTNYDRYLHLISSTTVAAERPDGQILTFRLSGSTWKPDTDSDYRLTNSGTSWTLTDHADIKEAYTAISGTQAQLTSITTAAGYAQTLAYSSGQLQTVTDSYSRQLGFTYTGATLTGVTTPDTAMLAYTFDTSGSSNRLRSVSYNTSPITSQAYLYENAGFPFALTGITDENGNRYATWGYDTAGRGISSQLAGGANATSISYAADGFSSTVTWPLGLQETMKFKTLQDVPKIVEIDRHDPSGSVPDAVETLTYDGNGYLNGFKDWNGNQTTYTNNANGDPTQIIEANGATVTRYTNINYDSTWTRKPHQVSLWNTSTVYTYDATAGTLLTKVVTDNSGTGVRGAFAPGTLTTSWTYTATGQLHTEQLPRTDVTAKTTYGYTGGTLTSISNALSQATTITSSTPGGRPLTVSDPNGVVTTLTYTPRNWLKTSSVATGAGTRLTTYGYDAAGNLTSVQLPGTATLTYSYDNAHRLTTTTDLNSQTINDTLDAQGDITAETYKDASGTAKRSASATFDALGRRLTQTGGAGQLTHYAYDPNGNLTSIIDPLNHPATTIAYDTLNRVSQVTDRASGLTKYSFDPFDQLTMVTTPNGAKTSYGYNGFEWRISQVSPDSGTTYFYYDGDGNLTKTVDAASITTTHAYDALDRRTGTSFPASAAENVTYAYDQAGHGFGIGRLTGMTDQAGTFTRSYDERGLVTSEGHSHGSYTLTTGYGYDAAGQLTSQTYPSGMVLTQTRDSLERITGLSLKPSATGTSQAVLTGIAYLPFGPPSSFTYGNGIAATRAYDADYRPTGVTDTGTAAVQNLTYTLNANDNATGIADAVTSANSQTLTYDALDRLLTASGGYGAESFTYDGNGNRTAAGSTALTYTASTNKLAKIGTQTVTTNANGNITNIAYTSGAIGFTYNNANRLATVTGAGALSYLYDGFGQRITKTDSAQRFIAYDQDGRYSEETDNTVTTKQDYIYLGSLPVATFVPNGTTGTLSFLHTDRLGTPRLATNASQTIGWSMATADPFGAPNTVSGNIIANDIRMPGQEYEQGSGHNHNGWRNYAPSLGRYIEQDPIGLDGGQASTYAYAGGNPAKIIDPIGLNGIEGGTSPEEPIEHDPGIVAPTNPFGLQETPLTEGPNGEPVINPAPFFVGGAPGGSISSPEDTSCNLASAERTNHILYGNQGGTGGHLYPGGAGKTPFPSTWNAERIMDSISNVATDPNATRATLPNGRTLVTGQFDHVQIRVILGSQSEHGRIITGYPLNLPRNPQ